MKEIMMTTTPLTRPNKKLVCKIANQIREVVEHKYGPQESARREIEYAFHAALLIVDDATRYQSEAHRLESFKRAAGMFAHIAETDYIRVMPHIEPFRPVAKVRN
jgi:hypothetical protein